MTSDIRRRLPRVLGRFGARQPVDARAIEGLLAPEAFQDALWKERARVDRGGAPFCMIALTIHADPGSKAFLQAAWVLAALLNERTRRIDTKGWFGDCIAVIFPLTPSTRVGHIWPPIKEAFDQRIHSGSGDTVAFPEVTYEVYAYPCEGNSRPLDPPQEGGS